MKNRRNRKLDYWQSYSDMMAGLLLIFILVMSMALIQSNQKIEENRRQEKQLNEQKKQINKLVGVKQDIISDLIDEFKKKNLSADIDKDTGAIRLDSQILFDLDKYELKKDGEKSLDDIMNVYLNVLFKTGYYENVSEIIIEGHTDTDGEYMYNLDLSQKRALSVVKYCLQSKNLNISGTQQEQLRKMLTANGKSESIPINQSNGEIDKEKSRRVEIKFRLKDDETVKAINDIMNENGD
jgi:outer membrane protein OmpA-like peptidoglycan-associated protein